MRGISVAPGVAIGEAVILEREDTRIPFRTVDKDDVPAELDKLDHAIAHSIEELHKQSAWLNTTLGHDAADVFEWHIGVLKDERLRHSVETMIREQCAAAAYATSTVMRNYQRRFMQMSDPLLVERVRDVQDIERRLLRHILGESREDLSHLTKPAILVAHDLTPTQTAGLAATKVVGVALDSGAATSHSAILLRSWGRPGVIALNDISSRVSGGDLVIIDGTNQLVIVQPNESTLEDYRRREAAFVRFTDTLDELRDLPAMTLDGTRISLNCNIEFPGEAAVGLSKGGDGIGLYRTEFLFLRPQGAPSEEEQFEAYKEAILGAAGRPVTIRTFDLGADKYTQERNYEQERNPMLGLRSIRYSLQNLDMFKVQLRAILRASSFGKVRLMFPLINSLIEFRQAKMTVHDAREDLEDVGIHAPTDIPIGMMLETPAAAIQVEEFCREVDFVSIGTNDLIQYLLAVDRGDERVAQFYTASHPSVLQTLRNIAKACTSAEIDCSLCGEMAGQPLYTIFLVGLGLRSLSMAPANIPEVKKLIRLITLPQARRVARRALSFDTDRQVTNYLRDETRKMLPEDPI
ncbi:MAG: phosphoenolpyruvate--protein phosphotransferase [Planctomycetes bacterium]|nr:phosphoenolpyruvate--protein phosphotransferase [Planctomycetota bacterium]MBI3835219.1 phosphoenolpyruvate--protein phosphotransferase [Planctomycetota bacterium]